MSKRHIILLGAAMICTAAVRAETINFYDFRGTSDGHNSSAVAAQLTADVSEAGGVVTFLFKNAGPIASSITDIYFDDGLYFSPLAGGTQFSDTGVAYTAPATPGDLSGGNEASPAFVTSNGLSADSDSPIMENGINPGEKLAVTLTLGSGKTFTDVINGLVDGSIRIGLHVQSIGSTGYSDSFINLPVPEPAELALCLVALVGVAVGYRRMKSVRALAA